MITDNMENGVDLNSERNTAHLKDRILSYARYLPYFALSIIIAISLSMVYLRYATPVFSVNASLLIKDEGRFNGAGEKFSEIMFFQENSNLSNEIEILRSQSLMERVVSTLNLRTSYYAIGKIKTANIYKDNPFSLNIESLKDSIFSFGFKITIINENQFTINEDKKPISFNQPFHLPRGLFRLIKNEELFSKRTTQEYNVIWSPTSIAASSIIGSLKIRPVNNSADVLYVSLTTENIRLGEDVVNTLMSEYNEATIEDKNQIAQSTYNFIDNRIRLLATELGDVEKNLEKYKRSNQIFNMEGQTELFADKFTELDKTANDNQVRLQIAKMVSEYVNNRSNIYNLVPSSLGIEDQTLNALVAEFNKLIVERERKISETGSENFLVKDLETKLSRARVSIIENINNLIRSYDAVGKSLRNQQRTLESQVSTVPNKEKQLRDIARQQGIKESLYLYLLQKREETAITLASTISNSRVVDQARSSSVPVSPNRGNTYMIALLIGIIIPFAVIYVLDLLNDKVQSKEDISKMTNIPMVGVVGHSTSDHMLLVTKTSRKVIAEQFRIIRTNLQYFLKQTPKPVILVTSSFSGEGKSFITTNLGAVMALAGKKTVILEFDIRKPKIASGLKIQKGTGITNYLIGNASLDEILISVDGIENLSVIPCGPIPPNPSELLLDEKLDELFAKLRERFDVILVDSAPIGLVSDALELGKYSSCTVYIIRQRYTLKRQLKLVDEMYRQKRLPQMSALLNDVKFKTTFYGYKSYGYGYGYGYGHGYYDADEPQRGGFIAKIKNLINRKSRKV